MRACVLLLAAGGSCFAEVEDRSTIQKSFTLPAGSRKIVVDNIHGGIRVTGHPGSQVEIKVDQRWAAPDTAGIAEARKEVKVEMTQEAGRVRVYVDGPFRCQDGSISWRDRDYKFVFDMELQVPQDAAVELKTVNKGSIQVSGVADFQVRHVNGSIGLTNMTGSGSAHTVNGGIDVKFARSPQSPASFKTINGNLTATYPPSVNADLKIKTLRGEALTDFETTLLPATGSAEKSGGGFLYRRGFARMRIGSGGPEQSFELINGEIRILKDKR